MGAPVFLGKYSDPAHEGATRTISYVGGRSYQIDGADEDKVPWKVTGKLNTATTLIVDFTSKGGPATVPAVQQPKTGDIKFPDGNVWKKIA
eukprot:4018351-Prymnesium_polylepis.2